MKPEWEEKSLEKCSKLYVKHGGAIHAQQACPTQWKWVTRVFSQFCTVCWAVLSAHITKRFLQKSPKNNLYIRYSSVDESVT